MTRKSHTTWDIPATTLLPLPSPSVPSSLSQSPRSMKRSTVRSFTSASLLSLFVTVYVVCVRGGRGMKILDLCKSNNAC